MSGGLLRANRGALCIDQLSRHLTPRPNQRSNDSINKSPWERFGPLRYGLRVDVDGLGRLGDRAAKKLDGVVLVHGG